MKKGVLLLTLFLFFGVFSFCRAAAELDVVINEVAWIGTSVSYNDEWVELYNNTDFPISLGGWSLKAKDGTPEINLAGEIPAKGFFLLERTDDETVPNISADQIYKGALGNNGENLELTDNLGNLVDSVNSGSVWFGGDNNTKKTMERKNTLISGNDSNNWQTSYNSGGTPKAKNSEQETMNNKQEETVKAKTEEKNQPVSQLTEKEIVSYPSGMIINEILPSPKGSDETEEWIVATIQQTRTGSVYL